jgi:hypothetical protein
MSPIPKNLPDKFGTIVNDIEPNKEAIDIERQIQEQTQKLGFNELTLKLSAELYQKLEQQAGFYKKSIEQQTCDVLAKALNVQIGNPVIDGPSYLSGGKTGKVVGPSFATRYNN